LLELDGLPGVHYRRRTVDAWELICRALDIMGERQSTKGGLGNETPTDERPLVRLLITELLPVVDSRPPAGVDDWTEYSRGRVDSRPTVDAWRKMVVQGLADIVRSGRDVNVVLDAGAQAAQVDQIPGQLRRMIPQRVLFRVANHSDIAPVIGDAAGVDAHQIPKWQHGACYLHARDGIAVFARCGHVPPEEFEAAVVAPLRKWGRRLFYVVNADTPTG
jgi:hypothetical protein